MEHDAVCAAAGVHRLCVHAVLGAVRLGFQNAVFKIRARDELGHGTAAGLLRSVTVPVSAHQPGGNSPPG